jgi:hypothetical protein
MALSGQCQKPLPRMTRPAAIRIVAGTVAAALGALFAPAGLARGLGARSDAESGATVA